MSRWSPDRLLIGLYPDRVLWLHHDARLRVRERRCVAAERDAGRPRWSAAVAAVGQELAAARVHARATFILSNHFTRYALVPWSVHAPDEKQRCEMARHAFMQIHGPAVANWSVQVSEGRLGSCAVASAVDRGLLDALDAAADAAHIDVESVQPHLMAAFNRFHARLGRRALWFAVVEPGALCLALLADGRWQRLVCRRSHEDWAKVLRGLLMQETCLGTAVATREVWLYAPGLAAKRVGVPGEWNVRYLWSSGDRKAAAGPLPAAVGG